MADFRKHGSKHDDPLAGLTARALGRSAAPASVCPDAGIIAAYFECSLSDDEMARHEQHFAACNRCQEQLAVMARLETAVPAAAADPSQATDRGWRRYWNWKMWVPATVALATLALWIAGTATMQRATAPVLDTQVAEDRAPQPAPSESPKVSADALSRKDAPAAAKPSSAENYEAKKDALTYRAKRGESIALAGRVNQAPATLSPSMVPPPPAPPAKETLAEEKALAKLEGADEGKLRDAQKSKQAAAGTVAPQIAVAAEAEQQRAQAKAKSSVEQGQVLNRERAASEGDVGFVGGLSGRRTRMSAYAMIHAPAPSLALWRIGPGSSIEKSVDSGRTWQSQAAPAQVALLAGAAASEKICWLVGNAGAVLRTTDGTKWEKLPAPADLDLVAVEARDAENATVTTADGRRFITSDGGRTWRFL